MLLLRRLLSSFSVLSAAMSLDSAAAFNERVIHRGLEAHLAHFQSIGWRTFGDIAFVSAYAPGGDEALFVSDIILRGLRDADHIDKPRLRRLYWEAFTLNTADLRRQVESGPSDVPRVVLNAEREERRARVERHLVGLELIDDLDVSDRLIDRCIAIYDNNRLAYLGPELCTKRDMEICDVQKDPTWATAPDLSGVLRLKRSDDDVRADLDSQFSLLYAFQRRGLALEMGEVMSFETHEILRR